MKTAAFWTEVLSACVAQDGTRDLDQDVEDVIASIQKDAIDTAWSEAEAWGADIEVLEAIRKIKGL